MPDCDDTLRELQTFLDGELSDDAVGTMQAHLDGCPDCLQAFDFHAELRSVIAAKCHDALPPGLLARLEQCLQADIDGDGRIG
ncbi:MAG: mycothiol system anti-sigma-R factor [Acidimicrobiia bacterium]|nr:mycothiol system anti-sigma-R factor [Acidimicrobiia bacterium]